MGDTIEQLLIIAGALLALYIALWFYILLPADMASNRNRDKVAWVLVSIFGSPFLAVFLLWMLGDAKGEQ